jgi:hypothetical protein
MMDAKFMEGHIGRCLGAWTAGQFLCSRQKFSCTHPVEVLTTRHWPVSIPQAADAGDTLYYKHGLLAAFAGYQVLVGLFFLLCLPLNILFNTVAISTTAVICSARQMAAAAHAQSSGPAASFTGQGSGKVGLAECRSTTSSMSSIDMLGSDEFTALGGDIGGSSTGSGSRQEGSSSKLKQEAAGSAAAVGMASSRSGYVTFRCSFSSTGDASSSSNTSGKHVGDSDRCTSPVSSRTPSRSRSRSPLQPAAAAPVPWVAAAFQPSSRQMKPLGLRSSIDIIIEAWSKRVRPQLQQLWRVDLLFNCWALPLQAACLAVVPVFWAFPRLLGIQLALPAAVLGGARGKQALEVSRNLMAGFRSTYAWPFVWLIVAARLVDLVRELVLVSIPVRWWTDVIEVPLAGTALFAVARLLLLRVQDLVPLAAYLTLTNAATTASRK